MSAPLLWIILPAFLAMLLAFIRGNPRLVYRLGLILTATFTLLAFVLPIDMVFTFGDSDIKLASSFTVLGRSLELLPDKQFMLQLFFALALFWLLGAYAIDAPWLFVPCSLVANSLLIASLTVQPFLYSSIFILLACLVLIPALLQQNRQAGSGVLRLIASFVLGSALLLFSGWMLGGVETAPASPAAVFRVIVMLGLGFAFVLAIFPFYSWVPMIMEQEHPYISGYLLIILPIFILLFGLNFLENFSWLRNSGEFKQLLVMVGVIMVVTGSIWAPFQKNLARIFGYTVIVENGLALMMIGSMTTTGFQVAAEMILPRVVAFGIWALCLTLLKQHHQSLDLTGLRGAGKSQVIISVGLLLAQFSLGGLPLLASYPLRVAALGVAASLSPLLNLAIIVGMVSIWAAGWITLSTLFGNELNWGRFFGPRTLQNVLITTGIIWLILLGLFPQVQAGLLHRLLTPFGHLLQL